MCVYMRACVHVYVERKSMLSGVRSYKDPFLYNPMMRASAPRPHVDVITSQRPHLHKYHHIGI